MNTTTNAPEDCAPVMTKKSTPVYPLESIEEFPLNPFREFVYYCVTTVMESFKDRTNMSLKDVWAKCANSENTIDEKGIGEIIDLVENRVPGLSMSKVEKTDDDNSLVISFQIKIKGADFGICKLYRHVAYTKSTVNSATSQHVAIELNFEDFDGFDFLEVSRKHNVLEFCKDDEDKESFDVFIAHLIGFANFLDFVRAYKAKDLITKNIKMFVDKFVSPYVMSTVVQFTVESFIIAVMCGDKLHRKVAPYEKYLTTIQEFGNAIVERYGETYKKVEKTDEKK